VVLRLGRGSDGNVTNPFSLAFTQKKRVLRRSPAAHLRSMFLKTLPGGDALERFRHPKLLAAYRRQELLVQKTRGVSRFAQRQPGSSP